MRIASMARAITGAIRARAMQPPTMSIARLIIDNISALRHPDVRRASLARTQRAKCASHMSERGRRQTPPSGRHLVPSAASHEGAVPWRNQSHRPAAGGGGEHVVARDQKWPRANRPCKRGGYEQGELQG